MTGVVRFGERWYGVFPVTCRSGSNVCAVNIFLFCMYFASIETLADIRVYHVCRNLSRTRTRVAKMTYHVFEPH